MAADSKQAAVDSWQLSVVYWIPYSCAVVLFFFLQNTWVFAAQNTTGYSLRQIDTWYCTKQRDRKAFSDIFKGKNVKTTWFKPCADQMHGTVSLKTKYSSILRINVNLKALSNNPRIIYTNDT